MLLVGCLQKRTHKIIFKIIFYSIFYFFFAIFFFKIHRQKRQNKNFQMFFLSHPESSIRVIDLLWLESRCHPQDSFLGHGPNSYSKKRHKMKKNHCRSRMGIVDPVSFWKNLSKIVIFSIFSSVSLKYLFFEKTPVKTPEKKFPNFSISGDLFFISFSQLRAIFVWNGFLQRFPQIFPFFI